MKRIFCLSVAVLLLAGCGQADEPAGSVDTAAPATTSAPAPSSTAAPTADTDAAANPPSQSTAAQGDRIQLAQADLSAVAAAGFVEGTHYRLLSSPTAPSGTTADAVEVNEFFMYSCIHCYNLEPFIQAWKQDMPGYVNLVPIPTTWDEYRILHARAFYAAESLGVLEESHLPFFRQIHDSENYLQSPAELAAFYSRFGVSAEDLEDALNDFSVSLKVNRANEIGARYNIQSTPSFVVNGKYQTDVSMSGGNPERLFELIELLSAAELGL